MRISPWMVVVVAAVLLAIGGFMLTDEGEPVRERRNAQPGQSPAAQRLGAEVCEQKCAALRKGYVYRAEPRADSGGGGIVESDACRCI